MADMRTDDDDLTLSRASGPHGAITDPDHLLAASAGPGTPGSAAIDDPTVARAEIEQTRARMSETIDEIESVLLKKKERLQDRLDVMAPVRERPIPSVAMVFGAGLVLGFLTGGGSDHDDDDIDAHLSEDLDVDRWTSRSRTWEKRARRLARVARAQDEELQELHARLGDDEGLDAGSRAAALKARLAHVRDGAGERLGGMRETAGDRLDVVKELAGEKAEELGDAMGDFRDAAQEVVSEFFSGLFHRLHDVQKKVRH